MNQVAIVTGGASGIGRALGEALAREGIIVTLADINGPLAQEVANSIVACGGQARAVTVDVTDAAAVQKLIEDTATQYGRLDYLFNNAGIAVIAEALDCTLEDWQRTLRVNLHGVVHGVVAAYPLMVKQGFGHIVNTASLAGLAPTALLSAYAATKWGIVGLSTSLRVEAQDLGVKVSVVCPGLIETPLKQTAKIIHFDREKSMNLLPKFISAEKCARVILRGVKRNRAIITVTAFAWFTWLAYRFCPGLFYWIARLSVRRMRKLRRESLAKNGDLGPVKK